MASESIKRSLKSNNGPISYVIEGSPIPLARIRISKYAHQGGGRRVYDSQKELKLVTSITIQSQHNDRPLFSGPLHMDMVFYFPIKKTRRDLKTGDYMPYKPDIDNCLKYLMDVCSNIIFDGDDSKVSEVTCKKIYTRTRPRTEFTVRELNG